MNPSIRKLVDIASKPVKKIIGLMSGTSLDGLDIALCEIQNSGEQTVIELLSFKTSEYPKDIKERLKKISSVPRVSLEEVCITHSWLGNYHGTLILNTLKEWEIDPSDIDCIASHGQTIYHAPAEQHKIDGMPNATLQICDGDHLATKTGILVISDFRQKHTAVGGEGAPMVSMADIILFRDGQEDRILLNIGGIANFTFLPSWQSDTMNPVTTDTGPGNTLIDASIQQFFNKDFDENGIIAQKGNIDFELLNVLMSHPFFERSVPKTTGPEIFNLEWIDQQIQKNELQTPAPEDLVATVTRLSAETIAKAIKKIPASSQNIEPAIYVSGGGMHNPALMRNIKELLPNYSILNFNEIGFDPDAKEAILFAILANELLSGSGFSIEMDPDSDRKINFGKISFPE